MTTDQIPQPFDPLEVIRNVAATWDEYTVWHEEGPAAVIVPPPAFDLLAKLKEAQQTARLAGRQWSFQHQFGADEPPDACPPLQAFDPIMAIQHVIATGTPYLIRDLAGDLAAAIIPWADKELLDDLRAAFAKARALPVGGAN